MAKVEFKRDYDHTWPSRAVTAFKSGWSGTVKQEVADAASAAGALVGSRAPRSENELPRNVPTLRKIAKEEGVDVDTGANATADGLIAAIEAHRRLVATPPSETSATPGAPAAPISSAPVLSTDAVSE